MVAYTHYESDPRVMREAEAAVDAGFEVDVLVLRRDGAPATEVVRGVRVLHLNQQKYRGERHVFYLFKYLEFFLRCLFKTTSLFVRRRYSIIHINNMPDFLVFCTVFPRLFGAKVILDIHDPMPNTFVSKFGGRESGFFYRLLLWQELLSAAYSSRVVTVSHPVKDGILLKHGMKDSSVDVIANFADGDIFAPRQTFSIEGKVRFVFHGTILERSGLRMLMDALSLCRHKDRITVKIIGEGDFSDELRRLIREFNLQDVVIFDNHCYPVRSITEQIKECNVGLVPLEISSVTNYALPLKLLEYISMGLPVVTVRNEAIAYYFNEEDCLFFEWNSPSSLSQVLDKIAENPDILLKFRQRALVLRDKFSWDVEKRRYGALLHQLSNGTSAFLDQ